jgi:hypothetical protein
VNKIKISIKFKTCIPSKFCLNINGVEILSSPVTHQLHVVDWEHSDQRQTHDFALALSGKRLHIDDQPSPEAADLVVNQSYHIEELKFNDINIWPLIRYRARFHHDNNGFGPVDTAFPSRDIGWDGELRFKFVTPLASWMIESFPHGCWQESDG